jgi:hypothetical protein
VISVFGVDDPITGIDIPPNIGHCVHLSYAEMNKAQLIDLVQRADHMGIAPKEVLRQWLLQNGEKVPDDEQRQQTPCGKPDADTQATQD